MTNLQHESLMKQANQAFRSKEYEKAIALYEKALYQEHGPQLQQIRFNLELAQKKRLNQQTHTPRSQGRDLLAACDYTMTQAQLSQGNNEQFLNWLCIIALGRPPQAHELAHYTFQLKTGASNRESIAKIIYSSEERKRYVSDHPTIAGDSARPYSIPTRGLIQPYEIRLPAYQKPKVSVLIPVYGKLEYTMACIKSISDNLPKASFEVIVLDDHSPDDSVKTLNKIKNLRVIVNSENLGFLRSCNNGAKHAKGAYLQFLNNDTLVMPGWLDELLATFDLFPHCGLAGSKLIYPDGFLQEAGGIVWQDGSAWNYGNRQDPALPQFNYAREVDYVSGAAIMVPKTLFDTSGGFDLDYVPAYCEDSDLALKIRDRGLRVIYQPASEVVHFEGVSSGTDTTHGIKAYQVINTQKIFRRWQHLLRSHRPNGQQVDAEKDRRMRHRVLVLEHCTPTPDQDAGSVSVFNIMLLMREMDFQITFIPEDNYLYDPKYTTKLQKAGIEVLYGPYITRVEKHLNEMGSRYDLIFLFRPKVVERNIEAIKRYAPQAKTLFYTHDIHHIRMEREARLLQSVTKQSEADDMKEREFAAIKSVDSTIVVSTTEMDILQPQLPDMRLELLPLLLNIPGTRAGYDQRKGIVFVGSYQHTPNVDAVHYFVAEIMPHIRKQIPGVKFHIVGSKPPEGVLDLASDDIVVEGFIEELNPFLDSMRVAVAPLRYGAGVKGKVGTALAAGLPVVATPIAAEGMKITAGQEALIAEKPRDFATRVVELYTNESLWNRLSQNGIGFAESKFGPSASYSVLSQIIRGLGFEIPATPRYPLSFYSPDIN